MHYRDVSLAVDRRRDRRTILLNLLPEWDGFSQLVELARERHWRLLDLRYRYGDLPGGIVPDGALLHALPDDRRVKSLLKMGCPVIRIGSMPHPDDALMPAVIPDWRAAGKMAAEHLAERGFRHFGYIGHHQPLVGQQQAQFEGLATAAAELGCECHLLELSHRSELDPPTKYRHRRAEIGAWLATVPRPLGLFCFVDGFAAMVCAICYDLGIVVPDDIAVLGCGDIPSASIGSWPTLSSIVPDHKREIEVAVGMLEKLMAGKRLSKTTIPIPPLRIAVRESTDVLAVADPNVARALRYIWDHLDLDLSVDQIARGVGVSRRTLERGFCKSLGRSVNVELRRKRLEQLKLLLRTTDTSITDLAPLVGFRSIQYLHRAFLAAFGMSPKVYRNTERVRQKDPNSG